jgi:hypothetical protein
MGCLVQLCPGSSPRILEGRAGGRSSREEDHLPRDPYPRQGDAVLHVRGREHETCWVTARVLWGCPAHHLALPDTEPCPCRVRGGGLIPVVMLGMVLSHVLRNTACVVVVQMTSRSGGSEDPRRVGDDVRFGYRPDGNGRKQRL